MLTHWKVTKNPDYLGSYALQPGQELVLTIKSGGVESITGVDGKKEDELVIHFMEDHKPMIRAFGEDVDALRIRDFVPKDVEVDVTKAIESINMCKTLDELKKTYMSLTKEEQGHPDVVKAKDNKKGGLK